VPARGDGNVVSACYVLFSRSSPVAFNRVCVCVNLLPCLPTEEDAARLSRICDGNSLPGAGAGAGPRSASRIFFPSADTEAGLRIRILD